MCDGEYAGDTMKNTIDKTYDWLGSWEYPGNGEYVIREDGRELEPSEVIDYIRRLQDLLLQLGRQNYEARADDDISQTL